MATMLSGGYAGLQDLSPSELRTTSGGCELFCALAKKLGYAYERSLDAAGALWTQLTEDGPSLCYRTKAG